MTNTDLLTRLADQLDRTAAALRDGDGWALNQDRAARNRRWADTLRSAAEGDRVAAALATQAL